MTRWVWLFIVAFGLFWAARQLRGCPTGGQAAPRLDLAEGVTQVALDEPERTPLIRDCQTFTVVKTHRYRAVGEVLSASTYTVVFTNDFFDVDLGLIWGDHVDALKSAYTFYQDHRFLFWRSEGPVSDADRADITLHIGNEHLLPAEGRPAIDRAIRWARAGDRVAIEGFLITLEDATGRQLAKSSTIRTDSGPGACEIVWVDRFQLGETVWE